MFSFLSKIKVWLAGAGAFIAALFYAKYQRQRADALEEATEALEEEIEVQERVSTTKEKVLSEGLRRRSEVYKELQDAKEQAKDMAYPDGKLDPEFIRLLNQGSTEDEGSSSS